MKLAPKSAGQADQASSDRTNRLSLMPPSRGTKSKKSHRRPHTSAGPSNSSNEFRRMDAAPYERKRPDQEQHTDEEKVSNSSEITVRGPLRVAIETRTVDRMGSISPTTSTRKRTIIAPAMSGSTSSNSGSTKVGSESSDDGSLPESSLDPNQVRAWEEELARIESRSRRSSKDMFSIFKRKRVHTVAREG